MDQNMDFGVNFSQDTMSSSQKRENQPGFGGDMINVTQNFLAAELGAGGFDQRPLNPQQTSVHNILSQEVSDFQKNIKSESELSSNQQDDDEYEHDSLNMSPTISKPIVDTENVKFISSTDLLDDFDSMKNNFKTEEIGENINAFVNNEKNEIIGNVGRPVNLEFKVEPDNVKLISSDTLFDDFEITKPSDKTVSYKLPEMKPAQSNDFENYDFSAPTESLPVISSAKIDVPIKPIEASTIVSDNLLGDFGISKDTESSEQEHKEFLDYEDEFFKSSSEFSPAKPKFNIETNEKFISAENLEVDDFQSSKVEDIIQLPTVTLTPELSKPTNIPLATTTYVKTEPPKTNIMQGEVIFHKPTGTGKTTNINIHSILESLIYWRDIKKSGIVFSIGLILLLALSCFSVISVIAYASLLTLTGAIVFRIYKYVLEMVNDAQEGHPFEIYLNADIDISQERIEQVCSLSVGNVNAFFAELKRLFLVEDYVESIKFGIILWILTYVGSWFNGMTLIILAYILLFTIPKVYEQNKEIIDQNIELARAKVAVITEKIHAVIPFGNAAVTSNKNK